MVIAGRVLIIPQGEWTNLRPYEMLDLVSEGDKAYLARQASVGMRPSEDASMTYWQPFGSSASIATTDAPGLVMPDGVTITVDATGLIVANLNVADLKDIKLTNLANGDFLKYDGTQNKWVNVTLGTAATRNATSSITSGSTALIESGAVNALKQTFTNNVNVNGSKNRFIFDIEKIIQNNTGGTWSGNTFTKSDATFTIDGDSVIFGGTPTGYVNFNFYQKISKPAIYKLSGLKDCTNVLFGGCTLYLNGSQVGSIVINSKNDTTLDLSAYTFDTISIDIKREGNNVAMSGTAFIMLCLKSDWDLDPTYVPPSKTNRELTLDSVTWHNLSEVGAVNYLNSDIATQNKYGATYTNLGGGKYKVEALEAPSNTSNCISTIAITLKKGTYKWTASEDGKSPIGSNACYAFIRGLNGTADWYRSYEAVYGYGIFTLTQDSTIELGLAVTANTAFSEITFYPMIAPVSYNGPHVPYAKNNQQLTAENKLLNDDITNKHKLTRKTVNTSSWTTDTTSQSGSTLYKKSITLSHVYVDSPSVDISTSTGSGLPTTAEQEAYDLLQYVTVDGTTMYLYATDIPSTTFYIGIEGVD